MNRGRTFFFYESDKINGYYIIKSPWYACALTVLCMFKYRDGPWIGRAAKDIGIMIAKLVYGQFQRPQLSDQTYSVFYLARRGAASPQYAPWRVHSYGAGIEETCLCSICYRPRGGDWECHIHGKMKPYVGRNLP